MQYHGYIPTVVSAFCLVADRFTGPFSSSGSGSLIPGSDLLCYPRLVWRYPAGYDPGNAPVVLMVGSIPSAGDLYRYFGPTVHRLRDESEHTWLLLGDHPYHIPADPVPYE